MKRPFFVLLAVLCLSAVAPAQQFKIIFGPSLSRLTQGGWPIPEFNFTPKTPGTISGGDGMGFSFGFGAEFAFSRRLGLEVDATYVSQGVSFRERRPPQGTRTPEFAEYADDYRLRGLRVPVLLKFSILPRRFPFLLAGAGFMYVISNRRSFHRTDGDPIPGWLLIPDFAQDVTRTTRRMAFGLLAGAGWTLPVLSERLSLEVLYDWGLTNLIRDPGFPDAAERSRSLTVLAGIRF